MKTHETTQNPSSPFWICFSFAGEEKSLVVPVILFHHPVDVGIKTHFWLPWEGLEESSLHSSTRQQLLLLKIAPIYSGKCYYWRSNEQDIATVRTISAPWFSADRTVDGSLCLVFPPESRRNGSVQYQLILLNCSLVFPPESRRNGSVQYRFMLLNYTFSVLYSPINKLPCISANPHPRRRVVPKLQWVLVRLILFVILHSEEGTRSEGKGTRVEERTIATFLMRTLFSSFSSLICLCRKIVVHRRESPRADRDKARWIYPLLMQPPGKDSIASLCLMQRSTSEPSGAVIPPWACKLSRCQSFPLLSRNAAAKCPRFF